MNSKINDNYAEDHILKHIDKELYKWLKRQRYVRRINILATAAKTRLRFTVPDDETALNYLNQLHAEHGLIGEMFEHKQCDGSTPARGGWICSVEIDAS